MRPHPATVARVAAFASLAVGLARPASGSFGLAPTSVTMDARDRSAAIAVTNNDLARRAYQVELFAWTQDGARQILAPATDMLATPAVFTLATGESQTVRVGARRAIPRAVEGTYRIILTEASSGLGRRSGVDVTTKASVPVFVEPERPERPKPVFSILRRDATHLELAIDNPGIQHIHVLDARVSDPATHQLYASGARGYVLAKQRQLFALTVQRTASTGSVAVRVTADDATYDATVPLRAP